MSEQDHSSVFSMDNPEFDWPNGEQPVATEQATTEQATATEAQQQEQPAATEQTTEQTAATTTEPDRFGDVAKAIRESERARAQAEVNQAIAERDRLWQQHLAQSQQQQTQQQEPPDPVIEPDAYREWVKQSVLAEVLPQVQTVQQQSAQAMYQQSLQMARQLRPDFDQLLAAANDLATKFPSLVSDVQTSDNPGLRIIELGEMALRSKQPATPAQGATVITDEIRQKVLTEEAAKRAAAGQPPSLNLPRGVGSATAGAGMSDTAPPPTEWTRLAAANPGEWERVKSQVLGGSGGVL